MIKKYYLNKLTLYMLIATTFIFSQSWYFVCKSIGKLLFPDSAGFIWQLYPIQPWTNSNKRTFCMLTHFQCINHELLVKRSKVSISSLQGQTKNIPDFNENGLIKKRIVWQHQILCYHGTCSTTNNLVPIESHWHRLNSMYFNLLLW